MIGPRFRRATCLVLSFGLFVLGALGSQAQYAQKSAIPPVTDPAGSSTPAKTQRVADLTSRYRFSERYTLKDEQASQGVLGANRVAMVETIKESLDVPQGAPKRTEESRQAIFTERAIEVTPQGGVAAVARTYERYRSKPEDSTRMMSAKPFDGLSVLIRPKFGELPLILSLTPGRLLTEYEYDIASHQVFAPHLAGFMPVQPLRVGDTWRLSRGSIQALLGEPTIQSDGLVGKLTEIRKDVDGPRMVASVTVTGKIAGVGGDTAVNAEVLFTFLPEIKPKFTTPKSAANPPVPRSADEDIVESKGAITEVRMARLTNGFQPNQGRLRFQTNRELTLHRQLGLVTGAIPPPRVAKAPEMSEANGWLTHVDSAGRYSLKHPQDLLAPDRSMTPPRPNTTLLVRNRAKTVDWIQFEFVPKVLSPEDLKKDLAEKYGKFKVEVIQGEETWLPEAEWPKMRVHRIDAELKVGDARAGSTLGSPRIHFDGYLIQFGQSASILAISTTTRDTVATYRQEVEKILKSIQLDPPRPVN